MSELRATSLWSLPVVMAELGKFDATEWIMGPLRRVIPPVRLGAAALDLSPIIILLGISILRGVIC